MRLLFITFAPFTIDSGHTARLTFTLNPLSKSNEIYILNLRKGDVNTETKKLYPKVEFLNSEAKFNGWSVENSEDIVKEVVNLVNEKHIDLVILQMEVWDMVRDLAIALKEITKLAVVFHGTPFLAAPLLPSVDFEKDVQNLLTNNLEKYKYDYISQHHKEVWEILPLIRVIANNNTVAHSLSTYFPKLKVWKMKQTIVVPNLLIPTMEVPKEFDFAYLARMERGKGVEYLSSILKCISDILERKVTLAIMGKCDDIFSKSSFEDLLKNASSSLHFEVTNYGFVDQKIKAEALSKSNVFLYPSVYDNYPTVVNEALSFGLPTVMWDTNIYRLNYQGCKGISSAPIGDTKDFAQKAVSLLKHINNARLSISKFINSFPGTEEIAESDLQLYSDITES